MYMYIHLNTVPAKLPEMGALTDTNPFYGDHDMLEIRTS